MKIIYSRPNQLFTICRKVKLGGRGDTHFSIHLFKFDSSHPWKILGFIHRLFIKSRRKIELNFQKEGSCLQNWKQLFKSDLQPLVTAKVNNYVLSLSFVLLCIVMLHENKSYREGSNSQKPGPRFSYTIGVTTVHPGQSRLTVSEGETLGNGAEVPIETLQAHPLKQKTQLTKKPKNKQNKKPTRKTKPNSLKSKTSCNCKKTCIPRKWAGCTYTQNM